ncbi:MAG: sugar transferase [candidate division Zixibacteria bacterium]|nr:sugar transferase [candidate division Zixibacteria bacterium]MDH3937220.1 sugar transferase [candidate division Zixibacteria bacterium]
MKRFTKKLLLSIHGQIGSAFLSVLALVGALVLTETLGSNFIEMAAILVLIRLVYRLTRGPKPVLTSASIRRRLGGVMVDELTILLALSASAFMLNWAVTNLTMGVYFAIDLLLQSTGMFLSRVTLAYLRERARVSKTLTFEKQAVIVGTGRQAQRLADRILDSPDVDTLLIGFLDYHKDYLWRYRDVPLIGRPEALEKLIATCQIDALIVAVEPPDLLRTRPLFELAERMGVTICFLPEPFRPKVARMRPGFMCGLPTVVYRAVPEDQSLLLVKALVDRIGALVGLLLAAPLMLATAMAIKLESRGPVFFRQERSGLNGKTFKLFKFRTMCADAEEKKDTLKEQNEMSGPVFKIARDPRITKIGRILRKYSIDEVPQFFNVLRGEMSLVGPRPPLPREVAEYDPWQHRKLSVKPGVTCLWQVNGRNQIDFEDWMRLDLEYIDHWSLWLDAKILARTIPAVIKGSGT